MLIEAGSPDGAAVSTNKYAEKLEGLHKSRRPLI